MPGQPTGRVTAAVEARTGRIIRIAGPVVATTGLEEVRLYDVVQVGKAGLIGEVIGLAGDVTTIQVYEDTSGLRVGEPLINTGKPLVATLGPGLLGSVYDGLQRPLVSSDHERAFLRRGRAEPPLPPARKWHFNPLMRAGQLVGPGDILGTVPEGQHLRHRVLVPPEISGRLQQIQTGEFAVNETVAIIAPEAAGDPIPLSLQHQWPVRQARPVARRYSSAVPLITGTRVIDVLFPVAKGGTAIIPGGFGTGKTVIEQSLARWADADVVVYIGCGERGNEMAEVLEEFPLLEDARNGAPLMERTVLIANTSNMPVAAREASIYTGITIAEYYRDMGYDVLLLADSTSRWGEALRELSGRLEEMPGEEGYPAYLAGRLSQFYERAGSAICLGRYAGDPANPGQDGEEPSPERRGSVTIVGAVSPPGGDFSEPMTQGSLRVAGTFWALDYELSRRRHFPAINWTRSYTLYEDLHRWYESHVAADWRRLAREAMVLLQEEDELQEIVQLVGPDALASEQREVLAVARMLREDFLHQSSFDDLDRYCPPVRAYWMLRVILKFHDQARKALAAGHALDEVLKLPIRMTIAQMKRIPAAEAVASLEQLDASIAVAFAELR